MLQNKHIVLGVTGSIAAYKSAILIRALRDQGAVVRVVMTEHAKRFITPLTLQALSAYPVYDDLFDPTLEAAMGHIELARWAEMVLIAPASADCVARLATGRANDLLTTLCLATRAPIVVVPAMNQMMWLHPTTQQHRQQLEQNHVIFLGPEEGDQACGEVGPGRLLEPDQIVQQVRQLFQPPLLAGKRILMTVGPTREALDPIRYLTNGSSGKMGFALASAAYQIGATVTVVNGPVTLSPPPGITCVSVHSALQMYTTVMQMVQNCDIFIAVAAVSDYRFETVADNKIHKTQDSLSVNMIRNPDILATVGALPQRPFTVGFTIETEQLIERAQAKRIQKKVDIMIANAASDVTGMGCDDNMVTVISGQETITLPRQSKTQLARQLIKMIAQDYLA